VKLSDQGAYTCEALNPNGSILATPDAILIVDNPPIKPTEGNMLIYTFFIIVVDVKV